MLLSGNTALVENERRFISVNDSSCGLAWTGNHRTVWFTFGSESSSACSFLGITYSFKVTRKHLKCLENAFPAIIKKNFLARAPPLPTRGLHAFGARRRPPLRILQPSLVGKECSCPPNRFHPVCLWLNLWLSHSSCTCGLTDCFGKEKKSIYIMPFILYMVLKCSDMDHTVLPANYIMTAFPM